MDLVWTEPREAATQIFKHKQIALMSHNPLVATESALV